MTESLRRCAAWNWKHLACLLVATAVLCGCASAPSIPTAAPTAVHATVPPTPAAPAPVPTSTTPAETAGLTEDEIKTLSSLEQVDDFPLYTLRYHGDYPAPYLAAEETPTARAGGQDAWGCSLFAALGDPSQRLFGRNFDWRYSPAVLLFTDPPDGYASVSMVDIEYLGFTETSAKNLTGLPLNARKALLDAPALPFDGMNEKGLAVGMAAVSPGNMARDPAKQTIDELAVIREILDHAASVDEAVEILGRYNIDMGEVPIHYLIASASGESVLVEFYQGKMEVFRGDGAWQAATNFLAAEVDGHMQGQDRRYDILHQRLQASGGKLDAAGALELLADVAQSGQGSVTQWSAVYDLTGGEVRVVMDRKYDQGEHNLRLEASEK